MRLAALRLEDGERRGVARRDLDRSLLCNRTRDLAHTIVAGGSVWLNGAIPHLRKGAENIHTPTMNLKNAAFLALV